VFLSQDTITRQIDRVQRKISEFYENQFLKDNILIFLYIRSYCISFDKDNMSIMIKKVRDIYLVSHTSQ